MPQFWPSTAPQTYATDCSTPLRLPRATWISELPLSTGSSVCLSSFIVGYLHPLNTSAVATLFSRRLESKTEESPFKLIPPRDASQTALITIRDNYSQELLQKLARWTSSCPLTHIVVHRPQCDSQSCLITTHRSKSSTDSEVRSIALLI